MKEQLKNLHWLFGCCTIFGFILLYTWFAAFALPGNLVCSLSFRLFEITQHECAVINYAGIALLKLIVLVFFLFPWLALRILLRKLN